MRPCHAFLLVFWMLFLGVYEGLKKAYSVQETFLCITFENACSSIFQGGLQDLQASFLACVKMKLFILCKSMLVIFSRWFKNIIFIHGETELVTTLKNGDYCICIKRRTCELPFPVSFAFLGLVSQYAVM